MTGLLKSRALSRCAIVTLMMGLPGCGGGGGTSESSADSGNTGTGTSGGAGTGGSGSSSTETASATGTGDSDSSDSGTESGPGDGDGDGDGPEQCGTDADCELVEDCCTCDAIPVGDPFQPCPADCLLPLCQAAEIGEATCRAGACTIRKRSCNPLNVSCQLPAPDCPEGTLAEVDDTSCWSGQCVEQQYCDYAASCSDCPADEICIEVQGWQPYFACEKPPPGCGDGTLIDCECASWFCDEIGMECGSGSADSDLSCYCPNC